MASITLDGVGKTYFGGAPAVTDISIDIADGEFCSSVRQDAGSPPCCA